MYSHAHRTLYFAGRLFPDERSLQHILAVSCEWLSLQEVNITDMIAFGGVCCVCEININVEILVCVFVISVNKIHCQVSMIYLFSHMTAILFLTVQIVRI